MSRLERASKQPQQRNLTTTGDGGGGRSLGALNISHDDDHAATQKAARELTKSSSREFNEREKEKKKK